MSREWWPPRAISVACFTRKKGFKTFCYSIKNFLEAHVQVLSRIKKEGNDLLLDWYSENIISLILGGGGIFVDC
jgi:hypothetical protein